MRTLSRWAAMAAVATGTLALLGTGTLALVATVHCGPTPLVGRLVASAALMAIVIGSFGLFGSAWNRILTRRVFWVSVAVVIAVHGVLAAIACRALLR